MGNDDNNIHPLYDCHTCHNTAKRLQRAGTESSICAHVWSAHIDNSKCQVCNIRLHTGGRPQKETKKYGRPNKASSKGIANGIVRKAPKSWKASQPLSLSRFLPSATTLSLTDFQCAICRNIVDQPVETPCQKLICAECICQHVHRAEDLTDMQCPSCDKSHSISSTSFPPASEVVLKVLGALLVCCEKPSCSAVVGLQHLAEHIESTCQLAVSTFSPSKLTVGQIMKRPLMSPPTPTEQKAAANVVRRLLHTSPFSPTPSSVVKLPTQGTVSEYMHVLQTYTHVHIRVHTCTCNWLWNIYMHM